MDSVTRMTAQTRVKELEEENAQLREALEAARKQAAMLRYKAQIGLLLTPEEMRGE